MCTRMHVCVCELLCASLHVISCDRNYVCFFSCSLSRSSNTVSSEVDGDIIRDSFALF